MQDLIGPEMCAQKIASRRIDHRQSRLRTQVPPRPVTRLVRATLSALLPLILFVPPLLFYFDLASSMALGTCAAAVIVMIAFAVRRRRRPGAGQTARLTIGATILLIVTIVCLHIGIASVIRPVDQLRAAMSLVPLTLTIFSGYGLGCILATARSAEIDRAVFLCFVLMCAFGLLAVAGVAPPTSIALFKPVFPFAEPSYFALAFLPLLMYCSVSVTGGARVIVLLIGLGMGLAVENLTLLTGWLLIAFICLRSPAIPLLLTSLGLVATQLDLSYYLDRLDFGGEVQNLSSLVYLQGWQLVGESLARSAGWGLGFQQLGVQGSDVVAADLIVAVLGDNANLLDGGFAFAKLVSEFGVLGLLLMCTYLLLAWRALRGLRLKSVGSGNHDPATTLARAVVACFLIEIFVRGSGYFSGTTLLLAAAATVLLRKAPLPRFDVVAATLRKRPRRRLPDAARTHDLNLPRIDAHPSVDRTT